MRQYRLLWIAAIALTALGTTVAFMEGRRTHGTSSNPSDQASRAVEFRAVTIPDGTTLTVSLDNSVGSASSRVDDPVRAHLVRPVTIDGMLVVPERSVVAGAVVAAVQSKRVKGRASITIRFDELRPADGTETFAIHTSAITRTARGTMKKDVLKVGIPAAAGAVLGAVLGGGTGAIAGTAIGGGAGAGYVMTHRGPEVALPGGTRVTVRLIDPVTIGVPLVAP